MKYKKIFVKKFVNIKRSIRFALRKRILMIDTKLEKALTIIQNMDRQPNNIAEIVDWFMHRAELTESEIKLLFKAFDAKLRELEV